MPTYDFRCEIGHTTEKRTGVEITSVLCPRCGKPAQRQSIYLDQVCITETGTRDTRRAEIPPDQRRYDKGFKLFQEAAQEQEHLHRQNEESAGHPLPSNPLWKKARKKARQIQQGIAPPLKTAV